MQESSPDLQTNPQARNGVVGSAASSSTSPRTGAINQDSSSLVLSTSDGAYERLTRRAASLRDTLKQLKAPRRRLDREVDREEDAVLSLLSGSSTPEVLRNDDASGTFSLRQLEILRQQATVLQANAPEMSLFVSSISSNAESPAPNAKRSVQTPPPQAPSVSAEYQRLGTPSPSWQLSPSEPSVISPAAPRNMLVEARDAGASPSAPVVQATATRGSLQPSKNAWALPAPPLAELPKAPCSVSPVRVLGDRRGEATPRLSKSALGMRKADFLFPAPRQVDSRDIVLPDRKEQAEQQLQRLQSNWVAEVQGQPESESRAAEALRQTGENSGVDTVGQPGACQISQPKQQWPTVAALPETISQLRQEVEDHRVQFKAEHRQWTDELAAVHGVISMTFENITDELRRAHSQWQSELSAAQSSESRMAGTLQNCEVNELSATLRNSNESWVEVQSVYEDARCAMTECIRLSAQMDEARRTMNSRICTEMDEAKRVMSYSERECAQLKSELAAAALSKEDMRQRLAKSESECARLQGSVEIDRGAHGDPSRAAEHNLVERVSYLENRSAQNRVVMGMLDASWGSGMASAHRAETSAAQEMHLLEKELRQHLFREGPEPESLWREEAMVAKAEVENLRKTLVKLECDKMCPPLQNQNTDGWEFDDLPEFMQQVAFAVAQLKRYRFNADLMRARTSHKARALWEERYWHEHEYWEGPSQQDFPFADLRSRDLMKISREAQEAYYAVLLKVGSAASGGASDSSGFASSDKVNKQAATFVKALARSMHRFLRMPGAQDAGMAWIKNAVRKAGVLSGVEEASQGDGKFGSAAEDDEFEDAVGRSEMAMRLPPAQFLRRIQEGFTPLSPLLVPGGRSL